MSKYVDLDEKVTAQFYDQEHEEWTRQKATIEDILESVCDECTILPSIQSEYEELTPEEVAADVAKGSIMPVWWYWLDIITQLNQRGYAVCRRRFSQFEK